MLIIFHILLVLIGITSIEYGIWVALHLKSLPAYPIWIGVSIATILVLKTGQMLGEILNAWQKSKTT